MTNRKRFFYFAAALLAIGVAAAAGLRWYAASLPMNIDLAEQDVRDAITHQHERVLAEDPKLAEEYRQSETQLAAVERVEPARRIRLAVGWLGLPDDAANRQAGDLILAGLNSETNLDLVDRQSLDAVLKEAALSFSGIVRAQSAVQVGKLLRADWFLLATAANIHGHQYVLARIVDARTGVARDLAALPNDNGPAALAAGLVGFVRQTRANASSSQRRTLLAIGTFRNLSANSHQADFGAQLNAHLLAAYQGSTNVTLLERECVNILLQEVRLDLAGMTDKSTVNNTIPMLTAMWMVDGDYQSYEVNGPEVELVLNVVQSFGRESSTTLRGAPDQAFFERVKKSLDGSLAGSQKGLLAPSFLRERDYHMERGVQLSQVLTGHILAFESPPMTPWLRLEDNDVAGAIRAYQTVLLLDPENRRAKAYLALCLEYAYTPGADNLEEARNYFRELAESTSHDEWTLNAMSALAWSYRHQDDARAAEWFRKAAALVTNDSYKTGRFQSEIRAIEGDMQDALLSRNRVNPTREDIAGDQFRTSIRRLNETAKTGNWAADIGTVEDVFDKFIAAGGSNRSASVQRLNEMLPELMQTYSNIAPHLLAYAFARQTETTNPLLAQFVDSVTDCAARADKIPVPGTYFSQVSGEAAQWCLDHNQYAVVPRLMEAKRRAIVLNSDIAGGGVVIRTGTVPTMKLSEVKLSSVDDLMLARAYVGLERWKDALDILESFPSRPVVSGDHDVWLKGTIPGVPSDLDAMCRRKLGLPVTTDPRVFTLDDPFLSYDRGLAFATGSDGLWIACGDKLLQLDFDLATNLTISLPSHGTPPSFVCVGSSQIYIGTFGAGLIAYDKQTRRCRHWTEEDGLFSDFISCLLLQGDTLWIGFADNMLLGGFGRLDVPTGRLSAFTPSVATSLQRNMRDWDSPTQGPRQAVVAVATGPDGNLFVASMNKGVQRYDVHQDTWQLYRYCSVQDMACNSTALFLADRWAGLSAGNSSLQMQTFSDGQWQGFGDKAAIPQQSVTAIALDGKDVWLGGRGFIGVFDPQLKAMRKFCYLRTLTVCRIEIAGGYVWAEANGWLFRIPHSVAE